MGLTGRPESAAYAREYLQVIVLYLFILPFNNTFNDFATQEGFPQLTTRAVVTGSVANVVLDILFIGVLGMGISGASLAYGYWEHRKHPFYTKFSLVDKMLSSIKFECSVDYELHNLDEIEKMMKLFADTCEMSDEVRYKMYSTIQALFKNALERRSSRLEYLDISLTELDDGFQMTIKDCGRPYDPVANGMDATSFGARSATYRYMFTMNVTTMVWNKI